LETPAVKGRKNFASKKYFCRALDKLEKRDMKIK
jgi:hypothetical protein